MDVVVGGFHVQRGVFFENGFSYLSYAYIPVIISCYLIMPLSFKRTRENQEAKTPPLP